MLNISNTEFTYQVDPSLVHRFRYISRVCSTLVVLLGGSVLIGWICDIDVLKNIHPSFATMKFNTALSFIALGVGLWRAANGERTRVIRLCGLFVVGLATVILAQYALGINVGIDELFVKDASHLTAPGRMAPVTALNFFLLGLGLLFIDVDARIRTTDITVVIVMGSSFLALCGYIYGATSLYKIGPYVSIAVHTTVGFLLACIALAFARPGLGLTKTIVSSTAAGALIRYLLPLIIIIPIILGWLRVRGQSIGLYDTAFGVAILVATNVGLLAAVLLVIASSLHRSELAADTKIRVSEAKYRDLYENAPDMYAALGIDTGKVFDCNQTLAKNLGYRKEEIIGRSILDFYKEYPYEHMEATRDHFQKTGSLNDIERLLMRKDGTTMEVSLSISAVTDTQGRFVQTRATWRDISARKQVERDQRFFLDLTDVLRSSTNVNEILYQVVVQLGQYLNASRCIFIEIDEAHDHAVIHPDFHRDLVSLAGPLVLSTFSRETAADLRIGRTVVLNDIEIDPRTAALFESAYRPIGIHAYVAVPLLRNGVWVVSLCVADHTARKWQAREIALIELVADRVWLWVEHLRVLATLRDKEMAETLRQSEARFVAEKEHALEQKQQRLTATLKEREVLLQEIHHRVKNNLQVISSLISLQIRQIRDDGSRTALHDCQTRISAIALIHEKLYQSQDYACVPFSAYAKSLVSTIFTATGISPERITLNFDIEPDITLAVDQAIPCGLILNELLTNALKHAFVDNQSGNIFVSLKKLTMEEMELCVRDDGIGFPAAFDIKNSSSLGMELVDTLVRQIDGELELTLTHPGTAFHVSFPLTT